MTERLTAHVPPSKRNTAGVTVAGIDLAEHADLTGLKPEIAARLAPYVGLSGIAALTALQLNPLTITAAEATTIEKWAGREEKPSKSVKAEG